MSAFLKTLLINTNPVKQIKVNGKELAISYEILALSKEASPIVETL